MRDEEHCLFSVFGTETDSQTDNQTTRQIDKTAIKTQKDRPLTDCPFDLTSLLQGCRSLKW